MTKLLTEAFEKASKLTPEEQDQVARWLLEELEDELKWSAAFAGSQDALSKLADEALKERSAGRTVPLDPDAL
jgi:hypothetical protein